MKKLIGAFVLLPSLMVHARESRDFVREFESRGAERLVIDVPLGELRVEGGPVDRVEARVRIDCKYRKSRCDELTENVDLVAKDRGGALVVELDGLSNWRTFGLDINIDIRAPSSIELDVDFGVGELEIEGFENDITVDQGVGELDVWMDGSRVESVDIDAGVGEAAIRYPGGHLETAGLFGNDLEWSEGSGAARVRLDLGVGEVDLRLR